MYAIVQSGGHQFRVAPGEIIEVERLDAEPGDEVELTEVLLVGGDEVRIGAPFVEGAVVRATVVDETKGPKLTVLKYKPKNRYRVKTGHRQRHTRPPICCIRPWHCPCSCWPAFPRGCPRLFSPPSARATSPSLW